LAGCEWCAQGCEMCLYGCKGMKVDVDTVDVWICGCVKYVCEMCECVESMCVGV
jgi:hypothetical protein